VAGSGPPPKPGAQRHRTDKPALSVVALPSRPAPAAPTHGWLKATREAWGEFWTHPISTITEDSDLPALWRMFDLRDERERSRRAIRKAGRLVEGSQGQLVLNPLLRQMQVLDAEIRALEDRFGLSPLARLRLGITFGEFSKTLQAVNAQLEEDEDGDDVDAGADPRFAALGESDPDG
jgi:P27 family predicted phage terminase small subunit